MKIKRLRKGRREALPCFVADSGGGGTVAEVPEDGFYISLNDQEKSYGVCFLTDRELARFGFLNVGGSSEKVKNLVELLSKLQMQKILEEFDSSEDATRRFKRMNKTQLAEKIIETVLSEYR